MRHRDQREDGGSKNEVDEGEKRRSNCKES